MFDTFFMARKRRKAPKILLEGPKYVETYVATCKALKVHKIENFSLAFFALSEPIWVCELKTGENNRIFYRLTPDLDGLWFLAAY